jgi:hypothetical protein
MSSARGSRAAVESCVLLQIMPGIIRVPFYEFEFPDTASLVGDVVKIMVCIHQNP